MFTQTVVTPSFQKRLLKAKEKLKSQLSSLENPDSTFFGLTNKEGYASFIAKNQERYDVLIAEFDEDLQYDITFALMEHIFAKVGWDLSVFFNRTSFGISTSTWTSGLVLDSDKETPLFLKILADKSNGDIKSTAQLHEIQQRFSDDAHPKWQKIVKRRKDVILRRNPDAFPKDEAELKRDSEIPERSPTPRSSYGQMQRKISLTKEPEAQALVQIEEDDDVDEHDSDENIATADPIKQSTQLVQETEEDDDAEKAAFYQIRNLFS